MKTAGGGVRGGRRERSTMCRWYVRRDSDREMGQRRPPVSPSTLRNACMLGSHWMGKKQRRFRWCRETRFESFAIFRVGCGNEEGKQAFRHFVVFGRGFRTELVKLTYFLEDRGVDRMLRDIWRIPIAPCKIEILKEREDIGVGFVAHDQHAKRKQRCHAVICDVVDFSRQYLPCSRRFFFSFSKRCTRQLSSESNPTTPRTRGSILIWLIESWLPLFGVCHSYRFLWDPLFERK